MEIRWCQLNIATFQFLLGLVFELLFFHCYFHSYHTSGSKLLGIFMCRNNRAELMQKFFSVGILSAKTKYKMYKKKTEKAHQGKLGNSSRKKNILRTTAWMNAITSAHEYAKRFTPCLWCWYSYDCFELRCWYTR